jgi:hypothetical protein
MSEENLHESHNAIRIPVVASYAYELVNMIFPLQGLPLRVRTKALGGSGDMVDSARYQMNCARLTFHNMRVVAEVRSWEPKPSEGEKRRKTLQRLSVSYSCKNEAAALELHRKLSAKHPNMKVQLSSVCRNLALPVWGVEAWFMENELVNNGPEIIIS